MKQKSNKKKSKKAIQRYNDANAKKNLKVTAMKTGVDLVGGIGIGTLLGSILGAWSPIVGVIALGAGHLAGDKSGVIRIAGASMTAYGLATAVENRTASKTSTVDGISLSGVTDGMKNRLNKLKENWIHAFYADKILNKGKKEDPIKDKSIDGLGVVDISPMNALDRIVENSGERFSRNNEFPQVEVLEEPDEFEQQFSTADYFEDETGELIQTKPRLEGAEDYDEEEHISYENVDFSTM